MKAYAKRAALALTVTLLAAPGVDAQIRVRVPDAWLGVSYDAQRTRPAATVRIIEVVEGSPAAKGGVQVGDEVVKVNGISADTELLGSIARALQPGDTVRLVVRRQERERQVIVVAEKAPESFRRRIEERTVFAIEPDSLRRRMRVVFDSMIVAFDSLRLPRFEVQRGDSGVMMFRFEGRGIDTMRLRSFPRGELEVRALPRGAAGNVMRLSMVTGLRAVAGAEFAVINDDLGAYFGVERGLLVTNVAPGTPAAQAGLEAGDVIVKATGRAIDDIDVLREIVARNRNETIDLEIVRAKKTRTLQLRLE